ncbi:MAG TPA: PQQ-dependent sugar dehydrogenase [Chthonomonadaceae bacterium]|nr:PQQ-dependent sugar dehydrogenase [Chthonomonadaceae bacterium]
MRGAGAVGDWTNDAPGVRHLVRLSDLPAPYATANIGNNPHVVPRPEGVTLKAPAGFKVEQYAQGMAGPRLIRSAPNGDIFVAESAQGRIRVLRGSAPDGRSEAAAVFAQGLRQPFGIAFYPPGPNPEFIYIAQPDSILRFPYRSGDLEARGPVETIVDNIPGGKNGGGGHWTRDLCFTPDGRKMYVSVGSHNNALEDMKPELDARRAAVIEFTPDGQSERIVATGMRNPVALALRPGTKGELWATVQERESLGDDLPADFVTRVVDGGFYGWPWYFSGPTEQPTLKGQRPELKRAVLEPDVLLQPHSAAMQLCFYTGSRFPKEYRNDLFVSLRGSSSRKTRTGCKVVRIHLKNGVPNGEYEDFLTGFVVNDTDVFGRPVGITTGADGALYVSEDANGTIWRVAYTGR